MPPTSPPHSRGHAQTLATNADQAEFIAVKHGSTVIDTGVNDEMIADAMHDFDVPESSSSAAWQQDAVTYEGAVGNVNDVVKGRLEFMNGIYPFRHEGGTLVHQQSDNLVYEFLLAICNAKNITNGDLADLPRFFERLSAKLVAAYFGPAAKSVHTGFPREDEVGTSFKKAMETLAARTGEWKWGPEDDLSDEQVKDAGCDFVVWPPAPDGRQIGQLYILGQCACGNNWQDKFQDLYVPELEKWFNPLSLVKPVRSFAVPYYVTTEMLPHASRNAGVVFDRARLVSISSRSPEVIDSGMRRRMRRLIQLVCE